MNSIHKSHSLYLTALALIGLPLLAASGSAAAQTTTASTPATNFNPPPCDYSDQFYQDNGLDPTQVVGRFGTSRMTGPPATGSQALDSLIGRLASGRSRRSRIRPPTANTCMRM